MLPLPISHSTKVSVFFFLSMSLVLTALWSPVGTSAHAAPAGVDPASIEFYTMSVQPILQANCYRCHGGINHRGGLTLDTPAGILRGGKEGLVVIAGHPEKSLLIKLIRHEGPADDPMPMPPKSKLSDVDIATITTWIHAGAILPKE
jgi:cytochrome c